MAEINLLDQYPRSQRKLDERGSAITEADRELSRQYGRDYFDGDRRHGYGGYTYQPRFWQPTVRRIHEHYGLGAGARILDVGCAKGFTLHDFKTLYPDVEVAGLDISEYALANSMESVRPFLQSGSAERLPYPDRSFDLVLAINTLHNLPEAECREAVREVQRVSRGHSFITVDAWRNQLEQERLFQWVLTAKTMMHVDDWKKLFDESGYTGDYYWFIAE